MTKAAKQTKRPQAYESGDSVERLVLERQQHAHKQPQSTAEDLCTTDGCECSRKDSHRAATRRYNKKPTREGANVQLAHGAGAGGIMGGDGEWWGNRCLMGKATTRRASTADVPTIARVSETNHDVNRATIRPKRSNRLAKVGRQSKYTCSHCINQRSSIA